MEENEKDTKWRISILRSNNLHFLRRGNGWRPLVVLSVDSHSNQFSVHETMLGSDGQNPNAKTGLDIINPLPSTKLTFEIVHSPPSKKKARRHSRTVLGSSVYKMSEIISLAKQQDHDSNHHRSSHHTIILGLNARVRTRDGASSGPTLHIKLISPNPSLNLTMHEEDEHSDATESDSEKTLNNDEHKPSPILTSPPTSLPTSPSKPGLRRRKRRRITGYTCDSGDEGQETWVSEEEQEEAEEDIDTPCYVDDNDCQDEVHAAPEFPWPHFFSVLGMAQPNPGILPSYTDNNIPHVPSGDQENSNDPVPPTQPEGQTWKWWEQLLCLFTVYRELKIAQYYEELDEEPSNELGSLAMEVKEQRFDRYDPIYQRLQVEWTYVGGLLIGLAAIDAAVFAMSPSEPDEFFAVDSYGRSAVSLSTIATAFGLLCDVYFLLHYAWGNVNTFVNRARPPSAHQSWGYFALSSRIPALCMLISILFLVAFLLLVACDAAPPVGLWFLGVLVGMGMWMQYLVRVGRTLGRGVRCIGRGIGYMYRGIWNRVTGLWRRADADASETGPTNSGAPAARVDSTGSERRGRTPVPPPPAVPRH